MKHDNIIEIFALVLGLNVCSNVQAQNLTEYAKQTKQEYAEKQRVEKQKYEEACQGGSLSALQEYAKLYPKGKYIDDVNNRIEEFSLWFSAKSTNTLSAYEQYLRQSKYKLFEKDAQSAITELNSQERWNAIRSSDNIDTIRGFLTEYPNSSCKENAQNRISELEALNFYKRGDLLTALDKFDKAGGRDNLYSANQTAYDECKEFYDYKCIVSELDCELFLEKYPRSAYCDDVSNKLAIKKAESLSIFSTEDTFNEILSYAKDATTRDVVQRYIEETKKSYTKYKRQERRSRIMANGGYVKFGLEFADFGMNCFVSDRYLDILYYNVGLSVKFGNYRSPVQFELGLKPGVFAYDFYDSDDSYDEFENATYKFHMPIYAKLKINVCSAGSSCKFYIAGIAAYNAVKVKSVENDYSVGGGLGVAWKRWDWFTLYYKQDVDDKYKFGSKFLGTSFVYYL